MPTAIDIAREMLRHIQAGKSTADMIAAVREQFPTATLEELKHACLVGKDQVVMWQETVAEDAMAVFDLMAKGATVDEIKAAIEQNKARAANIFPTKPDKTRS